MIQTKPRPSDIAHQAQDALSSIIIQVSSRYNGSATSLYNYHTNYNYLKEQHRLTNSSFIYMKTHPNPSQVPLDEEYKCVGQIRCREQSNRKIFEFKATEEDDIHNPYTTFYQSISSCISGQSSQPEYQLQVGDIIRWARLEYRVIQMKNEIETISIRNHNNLDRISEIFEADAADLKPEKVDQDELRCKFCYCEEQTPQNPLISPCYCMGKAGIIHVSCLKRYLSQNKQKIKNEGVMCYSIKELYCDFCLAPLPLIVKVQNNRFQMIPIPKPNSPYIILESYHNKVFNQGVRHFYLVPFKEQFVRIGFDQGCQVRLRDRTVSNHHSRIIFKDNAFVITDQQSTFGTLIKPNKPLQLRINEPLYFQYGCSLVKVSLKEETSVK